MSSFKAGQGNVKDSPLISIERVVAFLTPLFTAAGGALSIGAGSLVGVPAKDWTDLFIAGATPALGAALTWLFGRQKFIGGVQRAQQIEHELSNALAASPEGHLALTDIEAALKAHESNIIQALGNLVGAGPNAEEIAQRMLDGLLGRAAAASGGAPPVVTSPQAPGVQPAP